MWRSSSLRSGVCRALRTGRTAGGVGGVAVGTGRSGVAREAGGCSGLGSVRAEVSRLVRLGTGRGGVSRLTGGDGGRGTLRGGIGRACSDERGRGTLRGGIGRAARGRSPDPGAVAPPGCVTGGASTPMAVALITLTRWESALRG